MNKKKRACAYQIDDDFIIETRRNYGVLCIRYNNNSQIKLPKQIYHFRHLGTFMLYMLKYNQTHSAILQIQVGSLSIH